MFAPSPGMLLRVALPLSLLFVAVAAGVGLAYGTASPLAGWGPHGLALLLGCRRMQWPLAVGAVLPCLALVVVVATGRRRAWWLLGLAPVLALFGHRFVTGPAATFVVLDDPPMATTPFLHDDDWVVGIDHGGTRVAYPFAVLYHAPVVVRAEGDRRVVLFWSAGANRAVAETADWDLRGRDLDVVSFPAGSVLAYDARLGQFVVGATGRTPAGDVPEGFHDPVPTVKTTWGRWRSAHPDTAVVAPPDERWRTSPSSPVAPAAVRHATLTGAACVVTGPVPVAVPSAEVTGRPLNLPAGTLLVRVGDGVRAFDRTLPGGRVPRFAAAPTDPAHRAAAWVDDATGSEWSTGGAVVAGPKETAGVRLAAVPAEDDVYLGPMSYWYPGLRVEPAAEVAGDVATTPPTTRPATVPGRRKPQAVRRR